MPRPIEATSPVDIHVGKVLRAIRKTRSVSQDQLAQALAVSFQQVQKYENGANRISASKMFAAAKFLGVAPAAFFEGLDGASEAGPPASFTDFFVHDGALEIAEAFPKLSPSERRCVTALIVSMAADA